MTKHSRKAQKFFEHIYKNNYEQVKKMLQEGFNPNIKDGNNDLPLHIAVKKENFLMTELLLRHGAEANVRNAWNNTPLHLAASISRNSEIIRLLLKYGAKVNETGNDGWIGGWTPLHFAVKNNSDIEIILLLLENGANVKIYNDQEKTPLEIAEETGNSRIVDLLTKYISL